MKEQVGDRTLSGARNELLKPRGVKKNRGTGTGKPENRKTGNRETGSRFWFRFGKTKNRVPRFRYPVFGTRFLPGYRNRGKYIYFIIIIF